jgi:hypothetical protein
MTRVETEMDATRAEAARGLTDAENAMEAAIGRVERAAMGMHLPEPSPAEVLAAAGSDRLRAQLHASVLHTAAKAAVGRATVIDSEVLVPLAEFKALAQAAAMVEDRCPECFGELSEWGPIVADVRDSRGNYSDRPTGGEYRECTQCEKHREERGPVRVPVLKLGQGSYAREYNATGGNLNVRG